MSTVLAGNIERVNDNIIMRSECDLKLHYKGVELWSNNKQYYLRNCGFDIAIGEILLRTVFYKINVTSQARAKDFINKIIEEGSKIYKAKRQARFSK